MDVQDIFSFILKFSLIGSIIAIIILFIKKVLNNKLAAHWHYYIWLLLIIRLMIPYSFESSLSIPNLIPSMTEYTLNKSVQNPVKVSEPVTLTSNLNKENIVVGDEHSTFTSHTGNQSEVSSSIFNILGMVWIMGAVVMFLFILMVNIQYNWRLSKKERCKDEEILTLIDKCKEELNVRTNVQIIYDDKIESPSITGFFVPKISISKKLFESLSRNEKKYVLLHELTHIKKKDILIHWMSMVVQTIHWFNPIIWYSFYKMRKDCELSCDASILSRLKKDEQIVYGNTLLNVLERVSKPTVIPCSIGMSASKSDMRSRMERINMFKKQSRKWIIFSSLLALGIIIWGFTAFGTFNSANTPEFVDLQGNSYVEEKQLELIIEKIKRLQLQNGEYVYDIFNDNFINPEWIIASLDSSVFHFKGTYQNKEYYIDFYDWDRRWMEIKVNNKEVSKSELGDYFDNLINELTKN
ncbi:M56 family metallopeptidase [Chengkuizengella marina]|nr:M56 family metallopeptidase [Chengkuizengella marina]